MIKDCQRGYFLVETIISLTVVATIITVIYATITTSYIKQNDELTKFNTTQGLYTTKEINKYFQNDIDVLKNKITVSNSYIDLDSYVMENNNEQLTNFQEFYSKLNVKKLYFSNYDMTDLINNEVSASIKKNLKLENEKDANRCNYRYLIIFKDNSYSTVGIDCN